MSLTNETRRRLRLTLRGRVQGVGFRPFVYRLAREMGLSGWVSNSGEGVSIEVEGSDSKLERFRLRLREERPRSSRIAFEESRHLLAAGFGDFQIKAVESVGEHSAWVSPDFATCPECLHELFDSGNRRYRYPFLNCTQCGPRFTIVESLPYERGRTTMRRFGQCARCLEEFHSPSNRRFHAEPNACPECGPHIEGREEGLQAAIADLRSGKIVAVKGIGGFHLMVDARDEAAVKRLRRRKEREEKPFALLYPSLELLAGDCDFSEVESALLSSPEAPVVLLSRKQKSASGIAAGVAPESAWLGAMLPSNPLHHLLARALGFPVIATSGNRSEEPICIDNDEARIRLAGIADTFLAHDRPIARFIDDSVVRVVDGEELVLRAGRGYAPMAWEFTESGEKALGLGGHLKNTVALSRGKRLFLSPHIGDLTHPSARDAFAGTVRHLEGLYGKASVVCDSHPDYASSQFASELTELPVRVQHHFAHVMGCLFENGVVPPALGVAWDGSGLGDDGTIWGGEFLRVREKGFERVACLRPFALPGGEAAAREPARVALGLLTEIGEPHSGLGFSEAESRVIRSLLEKRIHCPMTSSAGRLFDGVAGLLGICRKAGYEGQAAMALESLASGVEADVAYPFDWLVREEGASWIDWEPLLRGIIADIGNGISSGLIASRFHLTLAEIIVDVAKRIGEEKVALSGGCFQNKVLTERVLHRLREEGFRPLRHHRIPPNDGGLAAGQLAAHSYQQGRSFVCA